ncbi:hypothetical protein BpHYR1_020960 [Brachionus plicatilis]|uniref:Uncharacterized protein n=1 Tax=Brachionus plicatilis TaxID=10195 RepID=A0A3M7RSY3_BRAPC|nr:hypothetical protein BpHYR1_020960 [Brachionus plicatilis]
MYTHYNFDFNFKKRPNTVSNIKKPSEVEYLSSGSFLKTLESTKPLSIRIKKNVQCSLSKQINNYCRKMESGFKFVDLTGKKNCDNRVNLFLVSKRKQTGDETSSLIENQENLAFGNN